MNASKDNMEHLISLKVLRLSRPSMSTPIAVSSDSTDLPGDLLNINLKQDPSADADIPSLASGQMMIVSQISDETHLGETFSCYIFIESSEAVSGVLVKVDLQTSSQRLTIVNPDPDKSKELLPGDTIDVIVSHESKEIGTHIVICEVSYLHPTDKTKRASFRKFYRFQVLKPLDIMTKIYNTESDEVFLDAHIKNFTSGPINLENVCFEPNPSFKVRCLNAQEKGRPGSGLLQPQSGRQYLYSVTPASVTHSSSESVATAMGVINIAWRSNMGERGRLQTLPLQRPPPEIGEIRISIIKLPNIVKLEEPFSFSCTVTNLSQRTMELTLMMDQQEDMWWVGVSGRSIGALEPGQGVPLDFTIVPLNKGLRPISGIRLWDGFLKRAYDYDDLAQVFVT